MMNVEENVQEQLSLNLMNKISFFRYPIKIMIKSTKPTTNPSPIGKAKTWKKKVPKYDKNQVKQFMPFIRKIQEEEMKEIDKEILEERKHDEEFYQKEKMQAEVHQLKITMVEENIDKLKKKKKDLFLKLKNIVDTDQETQIKKKQEEELKNEIYQQKLEEEKRNQQYYERRQNVSIMGTPTKSPLGQGPSSMLRSPLSGQPSQSYYFPEQQQNYQPVLEQHQPVYSSYQQSTTPPQTYSQNGMYSSSYQRNSYQGQNNNQGGGQGGYPSSNSSSGYSGNLNRNNFYNQGGQGYKRT
jgi:hypothetical protein